MGAPVFIAVHSVAGIDNCDERVIRICSARRTCSHCVDAVLMGARVAEEQLRKINIIHGTRVRLDTERR